MTKICLNMIVKNEAAIIDRCLRALADSIDCYVILDTGSTDGTQDIIKRTMKFHGIKGEVIQGTFINFSQARNTALGLARRSKLRWDYALLCDADMVLMGKLPRQLSAPAYTLVQRTNDLAYANVRLLRRNAAAQYVGATHEYLDVAGSYGEPLAEPWFLDLACGSNRADKFERDARLLEGAVAEDPDDTRAVFYLAQSYRDAGRTQDALDMYIRRSTMGGWAEEVWYSLFQAAVLAERLGCRPDTLDAMYLGAWNSRPTRAEPLVELARRYRNRGAYALAHLVASQAVMPRPDDILFVDEATYSWRALDEASIAAYWVGQYDESAELCRHLLAGTDLPPSERSRVEANLSFAQQRES